MTAVAGAAKPDRSHFDSHTRAADVQTGLPGSFGRPIKVTVFGAGSAFTPKLLNDLLHISGADRGEFVIVDIDAQRLTTMHRLVQKLAEQHGKPGWKVIATTDRREAMAGSDYLINCIEVSGLKCVRFDNDIPARYGVDQCIADTIGPGGLFKALRTAPAFLDILRDAEELCPGAIVLNYTNPMNILCLAAGRTRDIPVVGLCHSVQGTSHILADRAGIPYEQMQWECAGINHLAWFTSLRHQGRDLYPGLMEKARADLAGHPSDPNDAKDLVRKDMMLHFGAFITEQSGHLSEYLPYYRKRKELYALYIRDGFDGGSSFHANAWPGRRQLNDENRAAQLRGEKEIGGERTWEYASWIIEAREKNSPFCIHGNVMNVAARGHRRGAGPLISNLMHDGCVEVACMIDGNGVNPTAFGPLPAQMAAVCEWNMRMFDLAATACIEKSKEAAIHALLLDPLSAAICSPAEIKQMALDLFEAEKEFLPGYK